LANNCELYGNFVTGSHFGTHALPNNSQNLAI